MDGRITTNLFQKTLWGITALLILTACSSFISQHVLGMNPHVLCILQRLSTLAVGLATLSAAFFRRSSRLGRTVCALVVSIPAVYGAGVTIYQRYIQSLPLGTVPERGAPWTFRLKDWPLFEQYGPVIRGSGNYAVPDYLLEVPLPIWSVLYFCFVLLLTQFGQSKTRAVR